ESSQAQIFGGYADYDRIDARRDLSLGEVHLDAALVGPPEAFAKTRQRPCIRAQAIEFASIALRIAAYVPRLCLPARHADGLPRPLLNLGRQALPTLSH